MLAINIGNGAKCILTTPFRLFVKMSDKLSTEIGLVLEPLGFNFWEKGDDVVQLIKNFLQLCSRLPDVQNKLHGL